MKVTAQYCYELYLTHELRRHEKCENICNVPCTMRGNNDRNKRIRFQPTRNWIHRNTQFLDGLKSITSITITSHSARSISNIFT